MQRVTGAAVVITRAGADRSEIAAQGLQRRALDIDLACSPIAEAAKDRDRRAPTLDGMLEQECRNQGRQDEPARVTQYPQRHSGESERRSIRFQHPFEVPLLVELV